MTERSEGTPRWLAALVWASGAVVLYAVLLGRVTLDAVDAEYPRRDEIMSAASDSKRVVAEVGDEGEPSEEVDAALSTLPELFVLMAEDEKLRVVVTDAASLDDGDREHLSVVAGTFVASEVTVRIAHDASRPGLTALHEFGHFVDHALDSCSASDEFTTIYQAAVAKGHMGVYYQSDPVEAFAYMFSQYFFSDRRRARLKEDDPAAAAFFEKLTATAACPGIEKAI